MAANQIDTIPAGLLELMGSLMDLTIYKVHIVILANKDKSPKALLEAVSQEVGADLSRKMFEAQYGPAMSSYTRVGMAKTKARAAECNRMASTFLETAIELARQMEPEDRAALAERVDALLKQ